MVSEWREVRWREVEGVGRTGDAETEIVWEVVKETGDEGALSDARRAKHHQWTTGQQHGCHTMSHSEGLSLYNSRDPLPPPNIQVFVCFFFSSSTIRSMGAVCCRPTVSLFSAHPRLLHPPLNTARRL